MERRIQETPAMVIVVATVAMTAMAMPVTAGESRARDGQRAVLSASDAIA